MKTNAKAVDRRVDKTVRLAGGNGAFAAVQGAEALLRRAVLSCLLWENTFYADGKVIADNIKELIPQVDPVAVANLAIEARTKQKLRHVPLFIAREMARIPTHKHLVGKLLPQIILRADELSEFVAIYWKDGRQPLSKQVKLGLAEAFSRFDAYRFAKYNRDNAIKLRDVMFLVKPKPPQGKEELYRQLADDALPTPDTWEVALSTGQDKKAAWERLITERKLGALAFIRNLRNMETAKVSRTVIAKGFEQVDPAWLLPLNCLAAAKVAPQWEREIETLMLKCLALGQKLPGWTVLVVDVSGSMTRPVSNKSDLSRLDAACAMAMLSAEVCERVTIYATAGSDSARTHNTALVIPRRGFALTEKIYDAGRALGGGGIFTRQCLEFIRKDVGEEVPNRIIVFSDSQDCDHPYRRVPSPFGISNYIVDVSAESRGINYAGVWTAEVSGWSEHFLAFIAAHEGCSLEDTNDQS